jgi:hypothetical protein
MSDLFSSLSAAEHFRDLACVGYYNGDTGLAQGFAEAAEAIFSVWQSRARSNDRLLPPIAYNYRHAVELALKQAIRQAAACRQLDGDNDPGRFRRPSGRPGRRPLFVRGPRNTAVHSATR